MQSTLCVPCAGSTKKLNDDDDERETFYRLTLKFHQTYNADEFEEVKEELIKTIYVDKK